MNGLKLPLLWASFPPATLIGLLAAKYKPVQAEAASTLVISTLALAVTVPAILWLIVDAASERRTNSIGNETHANRRSAFLLPALLSMTAGAVDVISFLGLGELFTTHITGNLDIDDLGAELQDEGAKSFVSSWNDLMRVIASKSASLATVN